MRLVPAAFLASWLLVPAAADPGAGEGKVDFGRDIRPILANHCLLCHGPDPEARKADLRLDTREGALADLGGHAAVVPGKPDRSEMLARVLSKDRDEVMPPPKHGRRLDPKETALLRRWIEQGAPYQAHWAFVKPERAAPPAVKNPAACRNEVDRFVLARLEQEGLAYSPEADRLTLIRRLTLDLTGLPPTVEEADAFAADGDPHAYEKQVDRLLASPAYGERWAKVWLDLARYADSQGYAEDRPRVIWAWRDWLISALNRNLPYDQFTLQIMAGDLLPGATEDQIHATAFHRNTLTNTEGGTDDEEFRNAAIVDRVNTVMATWMGLTASCAQCHNHKYDPFTQEDYFRIFAFFNQTEDADRGDDAPTVPIWTTEQKGRRADLEAEIARLERAYAEETPALAAAREAWMQAFRQAPVWGPLAGASAVRVPGKGRFTVGVKEGEDLSGVPARFVRIELPGKGVYLSLAEVEVVSGGANVAPKGKAKQSSTAFNGAARLAIDGNTNGDYHAAGSVTHTDANDDPWWELDLGRTLPVERVRVWNRTDGGDGISSRLKGYRIRLLDEKRKPLQERRPEDFPKPSFEWVLDGVRQLEVVATRVEGEETWLALGAPAPAGALVVREEGKTGPVEASGSADPRLPGFIRTPDAVRALLAKDSRNADEKARIAAWHREVAPELAETRAALAAARKSLADLKPAATLPVMRELPANRRRKTQIQERGNFLVKGKEVAGGVPAGFPPLPKDAPANRLGFALWLIAPENPLTARVAVNRTWEQIFGTGLMGTSEDWGLRGELPSHPELLDALAAEFQSGGWDVKALLKKLVMSAAYRQASRATPEQVAKDPANRLLGRGPRQRLLAETVRDHALFAAGLLSRKIGGPSVYPPQPRLGLSAAFSSSTDWEASKGEDRYRRGLYTFWRRSVTYPSMATFDAPDRNVCTVKRTPTNTPLQALVTLNDPVYVEAAQALARGMAKHGAAWGFRRCVTRPPGAEELARLERLHAEMKARYGREPALAAKMATDPLGPLPAGADAADLAAWTVVGNVLLNLDEMFMKR
jgi:mono/diheme cytochrome c family protein